MTGPFHNMINNQSSLTSSDEADWRACVEYETKHVTIGDMNLQVYQMEELPITTSLFMLAEMDANVTEISGTRLWTGSHFLARYLWRHPGLVRGKRILELGAGTGICSIVSSKLGADTCLATDGDGEIVDLLTKNVRINEAESVVTARSLFWGDESSTQTLLKEFPGALLDVDVVLAGDVLYKSELIPLLFATVVRVLSVDDDVNRVFVLCHIPRADVTHDLVQRKIVDFGLKFNEVQLLREDIVDVVTELEECPVEDVERAKLYRITR